MNRFIKYKHCPILTSDDENYWNCQSSCCPYSTKEGCSLSPMIEGFRKIIYAEVERETEELEREILEKGDIECIKI